MRRDAGVDSKTDPPEPNENTTIHPQLTTLRPVPLPKGPVYADSYKYDHFHMQVKRRLMYLADGVLQECFFQIHQLTGIRDDHIEIVSFEIGVMTGNIVEKYKTMLTFFRQINDRFRYRSRVLGPRSYELWPLKYLVYYEYMHHIEMDIMQMLDIMEAVPKTDLEMKFRVDDSDAEDDKQENEKIEKAHQEENYKKKARQKYLMRRLGFPTNGSTVSRRFVEDWPVEETWDRIDYNLYK